LGLKVAEAPDFNTEPQVGATPVFADDNITVYSIPIVPTPHRDGDLPVATGPPLDESEASLKRKREPSPELPSKRPSLHSPSPATGESTAPLAKSPLLDRFLDDPQFNPTLLTGDEADAWRRLIIEYMFTWTEPPPKPRPPPKPPGKRGKRGQDADASNVPLPSAEASLPQAPHWVGDTVNKPLGRGPKGSSPAGSLKPLPAFTASMQGASMAYIVIGPRVRGKFDTKRAEELGLYGPLRGKVARGESVTFTVDDGTGGTLQRTVKPEDCMGEHETTKVRRLSLLHPNMLSKCVKVVMILDVPTPDHIESLASAFAAPAYSNFRVKHPDSRKDYAVHVIYHLLGSGVLEDERYMSFMGGFSDDTQHIICSSDHNPDPLTFTSAGLSQLRLNQLDPEMFPLPHYSTTPPKELSCASCLLQPLTRFRSHPFVTSVVPRLPPRCTPMQSNSYVDIRPPRLVSIDPVLTEKDKFHPAIAAETPPSLAPVTIEKFTKAQNAVATHLAELDGNVPKAGDELIVIPLGTNSAISSRYRNGDYHARLSFSSVVDSGIVSGHFVQIPDWGNLLLDAGEGTWGQMARYFGTDPAQPSNVWQALRDMKCIFISHAHADHHAGLAKILAMRKKVLHYMLFEYTLFSALTGIRARPSTPGTSLPDLDTTNSPLPARTCRFGNPWIIRFDGHRKWRHTHPERCVECQRAMSDRTDWVEPS
jgi:ribonuclease Z